MTHYKDLVLDSITSLFNNKKNTLNSTILDISNSMFTWFNLI